MKEFLDIRYKKTFINFFVFNIKYFERFNYPSN